MRKKKPSKVKGFHLRFHVFWGPKSHGSLYGRGWLLEPHSKGFTPPKINMEPGNDGFQ